VALKQKLPHIKESLAEESGGGQYGGIYRKIKPLSTETLAEWM
jgi:hypothetical protein